MSYASINTSEFPVIKIKFSSKEPTTQEFEKYLSSMDELYNTYQKFVLIFDASDTKYLSSELRIRQGNWMKQNEAKMKEKLLGMVFIIPSAVVRMLFNGILLIQKLPSAYTVCSNMEEAEKWAGSRVALVIR